MNAFFIKNDFIMRLIFIAFTVLLGLQSISGQESESVTQIDSLYREDQIYFSITYNILNEKPSYISQNGFSSGFHLGFIRDLPINKNRTIALGLGLGVSANSFNQNLRISKVNNQFEFHILSEGDFDKNKFDLYQVAIPFEFRWRTSSPEIYKFWRIYTGFKFGYVFASRSKFINVNETDRLSIEGAINKFQYGLTLSVGYDNWNLRLYYGLNSIFKNQTLDQDTLNVKALKLGLIFYIL